MDKNDFLEDVRQEIENIKKYATKEEKKKLDSFYFDPEDPNKCIYGLMTGYCRNDRAKFLISKCCVSIIENSFYANLNIEYLKVDVRGDNELLIDAKSCRLDSKDDNHDGLWYISSLEQYIMRSEANNDQIISYIKGETDSLEL